MPSLPAHTCLHVAVAVAVAVAAAVNACLPHTCRHVASASPPKFLLLLLSAAVSAVPAKKPAEGSRETECSAATPQARLFFGPFCCG